MSYPNRTLCSILEDMRSCWETRNFSYLEGLLEEAQWAANRMEAAIYDLKDIEEYKKQRSQEKKKLEETRKALKSLQEKFSPEIKKQIDEILGEEKSSRTMFEEFEEN